MSDFEGHTPGPWHMAGPVGSGTWIQSDAQPNIAAVHGAYTDRGLANARLIAAAPDLLAERDELRAQLTQVRALCDTMVATHDEVEADRDALRAALAQTVEALERALMDLSGDRSWCTGCRTEMWWPQGRARDFAHPHKPECALAAAKKALGGGMRDLGEHQPGCGVEWDPIACRPWRCTCGPAKRAPAIMRGGT